MIRKLLLDAAAAGLALTVFALFHHVLPRTQKSLNVQTIRPVQAEETAVPETEEVRTAEAKTEDRRAAAEPETDETAPAATTAEKTEGYRPTVLTTASSGRSDSGGRKSSSRQNSWKSGKSSGMNSKGGSALTENDEAAEASAEQRMKPRWRRNSRTGLRTP